MKETIGSLSSYITTIGEHSGEGRPCCAKAYQRSDSRVEFVESLAHVSVQLLGKHRYVRVKKSEQREKLEASSRHQRRMELYLSISAFFCFPIVFS